MGSMSAVMDGVRGLYLDTRYADLEIRCDGKSFKVHRAIVCPRSKVLDRECSSGFQESSTRVIRHVVFDANTIDRMIQFIYCGEYSTKASFNDLLQGTRLHPFKPTKETDSHSNPPHSTIYQSITTMPQYHQSKSFEELRLEDHNIDLLPLADAVEEHLQAYAVGDYYELQDLKDLAWMSFRYTMAHMRIDNEQTLIGIIKTIYGSTPASDKQLRPEILKICLEQKKNLLADNNFMTTLVEQTELQDFAIDFTKGLYNHYEDRDRPHQKEVEDLRAENQRLSTLATALAGISAQIAEFQARQTCWNCNRAWSFFLERYGTHGYLAKCNTCKAKHYSSYGPV